MRQLTALVFALMVGLLFSRTWKLISIGLVEDAAWGIPARRRLLQTLVVVGFLGIALFVRQRLVRRGVRVWPWLLGLGTLGLIAGEVHERLATGMVWAFLDRMLGRVVMPIHVYRADLTLVLGFGVLGTLLLGGVGGEARWRYRSLQALAVIILLLAGIDLVYFYSTAMMGDGFMVKFWLSHLSSIGFLVQSELNPLKLGAIFAYPLLVPLSLWLVERRYVALPRLPEWRPRQWLGAGVTTVATLWFAPDHAVNTYAHKRIADQFHVRLVSDLAGMAAAPGVEAGAHGEPYAEFEKLRFAPTPESQRLNVVFIVLESVRASSVTPYNPRLETTPFLAELAKKSLVIDDMHAVIPATSKAWTAIFTGLYPVSTMVAGMAETSRAGKTLPSLPRLLREHGYRSAFFTPAHLKFEQDEDVIRNREFDLVQAEGDYPTEGFERSNYYGHEDRIMLGPSMQWVDDVTREGRPFFLSYMTLTGHHDYRVPESFKKIRYPGVSNESLNDYLNCLRYIDDWMRDLVAQFEARKLLDNTVFVILGDHGQSFGEHGALHHISVVYQEATHVPALIYAPGLWREGRHVAGPRQQIDLLPTVADVLGYRLEGGFLPGMSLLEPVPSERKLYYSCWQDRTCTGVKQGNMKYIYWNATDALQAFDLAKDPDERVDLGPRLSETKVREVRGEMATWQSRAVSTYLGMR